MSRARITAAVTLLISCLVSPAWAQVQNLEAGKSASQLFASTCTACHKSPRGLLKSVSPGSLPGFLREHYTTSGDMASQLSSFLISNGASDARQAKPGADKPGQGGNDQPDRQGRRNRNAPVQEAVRPDEDLPPGEGARQSRRRQPRPDDLPDDARPPGSVPAQAGVERGPDGRKLKRAGKRGRPGTEESPAVKDEQSPAMEPPKADSAKGEPASDGNAKNAAPKEEMGTAERAKPDAEGKPGEARIEAPKDASAAGDKPVERRDPVPPAAAPSTTSSEPAAAKPSAAASPESSAAVTASVPPPSPTGPPAPPISQ